jgi:hypothetical protein
MHHEHRKLKISSIHNISESPGMNNFGIAEAKGVHGV